MALVYRLCVYWFSVAIELLAVGGITLGLLRASTDQVPDLSAEK